MIILYVLLETFFLISYYITIYTTIEITKTHLLIDIVSAIKFTMTFVRCRREIFEELGNQTCQVADMARLPYVQVFIVIKAM